MSDSVSQLRDAILAQIDKRQRGKWRIPVADLMQIFGFKAERRVSQSSLGWVLATLNEWNIGYELPGGTSVYDEVILFRITPTPVVAPKPGASAPAVQPDRSGTIDPITQSAALPASPLALLFSINGSPDAGHSHADARNIQHAIWAYRPVCLFVDADNELFSFLCGYISALMRRRARTIRIASYDSIPLTVEILAAARLKEYLGGDENGIQRSRFPEDGAVYLVRENPDDLEDNETVWSAREQFIPHTYTLVARFGPTVVAPDQPNQLRTSPQFNEVFRWISAFAGIPGAQEPPEGQPVDISTLLADACQALDSLLFQQTLQLVDGAFRAGYESTEHMALKSALLTYLRNRFPQEEIAVEELVDIAEEDLVEDRAPGDLQRRNKPDLRVGARIWVEVETLRGLALRGSSPFFVLEDKLRQKLLGMRNVNEVWLIVPSDLALLSTEHIQAVARNLNNALGTMKVRYGYVDLERQTPVLFDPPPPAPIVVPRISGVSLRQEAPAHAAPLSLRDIAGYADVKRTLQSSLLDPLMKRHIYARYGAFAARGLLLYGLPGCGKSWIGKVLADTAGIVAKVVLPSDLTSKWLGEGVAKTRALFDWAAKQGDCLLVLDELDAVAPQRSIHNMHTDEKRQVNELLVQIDRMSQRGVILVGTTNFLRGIDSAIQRSGRFDMKLPIFPPTEDDRRAIFAYYLTPPRLKDVQGAESVDIDHLARSTPLYTPADIQGVVHDSVRQSIFRLRDDETPVITTDDLLGSIRRRGRSIQREQVQNWLAEVRDDQGLVSDQMNWLEEEIARAYP